ncbi:MAG: PIN domain-containing protein [Armatimonadota bacterium]|nr:PIN domain-containing protein [Armatimonadota bacterium]
MVGRILPIEDADVYQARDLAGRYPYLSPRDLIHLAVMLRHRIRDIITTEEGFNTIKEVRRLDPSRFVPSSAGSG